MGGKPETKFDPKRPSKLRLNVTVGKKIELKIMLNKTPMRRLGFKRRNKHHFFLLYDFGFSGMSP